MDRAHRAVALVLPGLHATLDRPAEEARVHGRHPAHELLLQERWQVALVEQDRVEAFAIRGEEAVEQCRSASGMADHEDRRADLLPAKAREEQRVEREADRMEGGDQRDDDPQLHEEAAAGRGVGLRRSEPDHLPPDAEVEEEHVSRLHGDGGGNQLERLGVFCNSGAALRARALARAPLGCASLRAPAGRALATSTSDGAAAVEHARTGLHAKACAWLSEPASRGASGCRRGRRSWA